MIDWDKVDADGATEDERRQLRSIDDAASALQRGGSAFDLEAVRMTANWLSGERMGAALVAMLDAGEAWVTVIDGRLVYQHPDLGGRDGGIDIGPAAEGTPDESL